ncbi:MULTISPECIES: hypothetical protein [unclassified Bradyrhizobium]
MDDVLVQSRDRKDAKRLLRKLLKNSAMSSRASSSRSLGHMALLARSFLMLCVTPAPVSL